MHGHTYIKFTARMIRFEGHGRDEKYILSIIWKIFS